jgi:hypothetical protein
MAGRGLRQTLAVGRFDSSVLRVSKSGLGLGVPRARSAAHAPLTIGGLSPDRSPDAKHLEIGTANSIGLRRCVGARLSRILFRDKQMENGKSQGADFVLTRRETAERLRISLRTLSRM